MSKRFTFADLNFKEDPHLAEKYQTTFIRTLSFRKSAKYCSIAGLQKYI